MIEGLVKFALDAGFQLSTQARPVTDLETLENFVMIWMKHIKLSLEGQKQEIDSLKDKLVELNRQADGFKYTYQKYHAINCCYYEALESIVRYQHPQTSEVATKAIRRAVMIKGDYLNA